MSEQVNFFKNYAHELRLGLAMGFICILLVVAPWPKESDELQSLRTQLEVYKLLTEHDENIGKRLKNVTDLEKTIVRLNRDVADKNATIMNLKKEAAQKDKELKKFSEWKVLSEGICGKNNYLIHSIQRERTHLTNRLKQESCK